MGLDKSNEITSITFDHEGAHIALCHKAQGYGANGKPRALLIKSEELEVPEEAKSDLELIKAAQEVQINTTMQEFLRKWMGMCWDDAETLAKILGYEGNGEDALDWIEEKVGQVTLLKSKELKEKATVEDIKALEEFIKSNSLTSSLSEGNPDMKDEPQAHKPSEKLTKTQGDLMATDQEKLEKALKDQAELTAKLEEFEKAANEAKEDAKALAAKVESFEKAAEERLDKAFQAKVADYSFITEDARVEFAKTLRELNSELMVEALDKAQAAIDAIDEVQGKDEGSTILEKSSSLSDKLLAKYGDVK